MSALSRTTPPFSATSTDVAPEAAATEQVPRSRFVVVLSTRVLPTSQYTASPCAMTSGVSLTSVHTPSVCAAMRSPLVPEVNGM